MILFPEYPEYPESVAAQQKRERPSPLSIHSTAHRRTTHDRTRHNPSQEARSTPVHARRTIHSSARSRQHARSIRSRHSPEGTLARSSAVLARSAARRPPPARAAKHSQPFVPSPTTPFARVVDPPAAVRPRRQSLPAYRTASTSTQGWPRRWRFGGGKLAARLHRRLDD